jgi:hypothetical protein
MGSWGGASLALRGVLVRAREALRGVEYHTDDIIQRAMLRGAIAGLRCGAHGAEALAAEGGSACCLACGCGYTVSQSVAHGLQSVTGRCNRLHGGSPLTPTSC